MFMSVVTMLLNVKECKSYKYLSLMVDNLFKFDIHIDYIKKKIQKK